MNKEVIRQMIDVELYKLGQVEKKTMLNNLYDLANSIEVDADWRNQLISNKKSLERHVFDATIAYMKECNYTIDELWSINNRPEMLSYIYNY